MLAYLIATNVTGSILRSIASHNGSVGFLIDAGAIATLADCKVSNTYDVFAFRYGVLVRGSGTTAMIARCDVFGKSQGYVASDGARVQVTDSSAETGGVGFRAQDSGTLMVAERSTSTGNQSGFAAVGGATLSMSNCTSTFNSLAGAVGVSGGVVETRQNNTVRKNASDTSGTITPFGPL
jgi:Right handed beta helix region